MEPDSLNWLILGIALIVAEMVVPGFFLLWMGIGSLLLSLIVWIFPQLPLLAQVLMFGLLTLSSILLSRRYLKSDICQTDQPNLNRRGAQYIGKHYLVENAIVNGTGKIRIGDTVWSVRGPDCPKQTRVQVTAVDGIVLVVEIAPGPN